MKQYDSSELMDIHSLAECDLQWAYTAINDTKLALREIEKLSKIMSELLNIIYTLFFKN